MRWELEGKFGNVIADQIITRKEMDQELAKAEVRYHPELPEEEVR